MIVLVDFYVLYKYTNFAGNCWYPSRSLRQQTSVIMFQSRNISSDKEVWVFNDTDAIIHDIIYRSYIKGGI